MKESTCLGILWTSLPPPPPPEYDLNSPISCFSKGSHQYYGNTKFDNVNQKLNLAKKCSSIPSSIFFFLYQGLSWRRIENEGVFRRGGLCRSRRCWLLRRNGEDLHRGSYKRIDQVLFCLRETINDVTQYWSIFDTPLPSIFTLFSTYYFILSLQNN